MEKLWKVKMIVFGIVAFTAFTAIVMWIWNWLVPDLFHGPVINFSQAIGLLFLSRLLFGGFHGMKGGRMHNRYWGRWKERWEKMNPEQRDKMRELWKKRCGGFYFDEEKKDDVVKD